MVFWDVTMWFIKIMVFWGVTPCDLICRYQDYETELPGSLIPLSVPLIEVWEGNESSTIYILFYFY
jgi:hypothetical protein